MNIKYLKSFLVGSTLAISSFSNAALIYDTDVTNEVIFGSGNSNGSFSVVQDSGIEIGLRGKLRHNAIGAAENTFNSNGNGTYSFDAGVAPTQAAPTAVWSFEWSINSNFDGTGGFLNDYRYLLSIDTDPSAVTSFLNFDPINDINPGSGFLAWDHSIGNNGTVNGAGIESSSSDAATYAGLISSNNIAQNSWKPHWFIPGFDPTVDGTYNFALTAMDANGANLASTSIQIIVGAGATAVPEPSTLAIFALGMIGLASRRFKKQS